MFILSVTKGIRMKIINSVRFLLSVLAMLVLAFPARAHADSGGTNAEQAFNIMEVVGHNDLGLRGYNADAWVHKGRLTWGYGALAIGPPDRRIASARQAQIPVP